MLVTCSAHTANNGTGSPPHLVPLSRLYLTLATSLLRFVPTVGVVSVLCMRAVTCKNGRRRSYFGSFCTWIASTPLPIFSLAPFIHTLLLLSLWWLQGSGWHCGQCMLHIISFITREKKRKKINCAASNLIGSSRFFLAFQAYFCFIHALHYHAEGMCTFYLCLHLALGHKSAKTLTYYIFLINIQRRILNASNRSQFFCPSMC